MSIQFNKNTFNNKKQKNITNITKEKQANISQVPLPISLRPSKSILEKSKLFKKKNINKSTSIHSYTQVPKDDIKEIMKIKEAFLNLSVNKISEIYKVINKLSQKEKPKINITTKRLSRKQIIIFMGANNTKRVMV